MPEQKLPFVRSLVVLTNDEAEIDGTTSARHVDLDHGTVTLDGTEELVNYLKRGLNYDASHGRTLTDQQFRRLVEQLDREAQQASVDYEDQIPGYRIREDRGSAPSYITYIAQRHPNIDNRLYRLRVFGKLSTDLPTRERQLRSLKAADALPYHPNIRRVHPHANEHDLIVEVSDWTETYSLDDVLAEQQRLDWRRATTIARDVARALAFIHDSAAGLVHRNVQPKSILIAADGHAELTDFDLSFDPNANLTVLGTHAEDYLALGYAAPELLQGRADFQSDVYSLGVVWFHMLVGRVPSSLAAVESALHDALASAACSDQDRARLTHLIVRMMAPLPAARPGIKDVLSAISSLIEPVAAVAQSLSRENEERTTYTDSERIAEGATAEVFRVDNHGEIFVQKVFKSTVPRDQALHERDILRAVDHLGLQVSFPRVRHFSEVDGQRWCLATDLVPGDPLRAWIDAGIPPSLPEFMGVARALLEALAKLHAAEILDGGGIMHNDLNPNNILFDQQRNMVGLIDFGAASGQGVVSLRGTPGYVHPALVSRSDMNACPQGDVFALARTLGQWLIGNDAIDLVTFDTIADPRRVNVLRILQGALALDACVYPSAAALLAELEVAYSVTLDTDDAGATPPPQDLVEPEAALNTGDGAAFDGPTDGGTTGLHAATFVQYLNTLHNVSAGNANALAEYQSTNAYFASIYESVPIAHDIYRRLTGPADSIVVLSGHAGDGKSTIALEVLKRLKGLAPTASLTEAPHPHERVIVDGRSISILKDMSEHTATARRAKFQEALRDDSGSWLIVSNTGPLLNTLQDLKGDIEEAVLVSLAQPIGDALHDRHRIDGFDKPIFIANLSKLDNVGTAVNVFTKMVSSEAWDSCAQCSVRTGCPIRNNVEAIRQSPESTERVAWLYRLLTSYERRLTMRQMTAHLAYAITGGSECAQIPELIAQIGTETALRRHLFSELFFGYSDGRPNSTSIDLYCVAQLQVQLASEHTRPVVELKLHSDALADVAPLPALVLSAVQHWRKHAADADEGARARAALRRSAFMFGKRYDERWWKSFIEDFTGSHKLQEWEQWRVQGQVPSSATVRRDLVRKILSVLSEHCTGFGRSPLGGNKLYVTLRRDDLEATQPVQVVIGEYDDKNFELRFDPEEALPRLVYRPAEDRVFMRLSLPLLDFVSRRSTGDFGQSLDPIYINQLDLFCSQLVASDRLPEGDILLFCVAPTGQQHVYRVEIDDFGMEIS
ncbi:MAG: serine/threonine protein kinase [Burkholderiales bacterium]